jgi:hypothetical protein
MISTAPEPINVLDTTLSTHFVPGTNVKGDAAGASWSFMLPSLELEQVVCLGLPRQETLIALARFAGKVLVFCSGQRELHRARHMRERRELGNVSVATRQDDRLPLADGATDLVVVCQRGFVRRLERDADEQVEVRRILADSGSLCVERWSSRIDAVSGQLNGSLGSTLAQELFVMTPRLGEAGTAVPIEDRRTLDYFASHKLECSSFQRRPLKRASALIGGWSAADRFGRRTCLLASGAETDLAGSPPRYVRDIARAGGVDIDAYRWGLSAPGRYTSRKVVLFLFAPENDMPDYVVKLTRTGEMNYRLENECRALELLADVDGLDTSSVPRAVFSGHHAGLAVVGESAIDGVPLLSRTDGSPACPLGGTAISWLHDLGCRTADPEAASPREVADGLARLLERFIEIYRPAARHRAFLESQIVRVATAGGQFPLVFQHGDPGVWNVMATGDESVAFLDWEAAEPQGMPLWDLFYFLRSYCMRSVSVRGKRARLDALARLFLADSPLATLVVDSTRRYTAGTGLPGELVEPLFYTCWMHRALKEATRLVPSKLSTGHYYQLLLLAIERNDEQALRRLFST